MTRVRAGSENVRRLSEAFHGIESESQNVGRLVTEISAATNEQAQGVDQVNTAVAQMDKVTQTNAATAEQSSASASELSQQATSLNSLVSELAGLVYGGGRQLMRIDNDRASPRPPRRTPAEKAAQKALPPPPADAGVKVMRPREVIPFGEGDDF